MFIFDEYNSDSSIQNIIIRLLVFFKCEIFFLKSIKKKSNIKIKPLQLEGLDWINDQENSAHDPKKLSFNSEKEILKKNFTYNILNLFNHKHTITELTPALRRSVNWNHMNIVSKIDVFLNNRYSQSLVSKPSCYLLIFSKSNLILPNFQNPVYVCRLSFLSSAHYIINIFIKLLKLIQKKIKVLTGVKLIEKGNNENYKFKNLKVLHILHHGWQYGSWQKDYINYEKSKFKKEEVGYFDYAKDYKYKNIPYFFIQPNFLKMVKFINFNFLKKFFYLLFSSRSSNQIQTSLFYARFFLEIKHYQLVFSSFKQTKIAIIDYEDLCPHSIILALQNSGIKTIAIQQRFSNINYHYPQVILDYYLVCSQLIKKKMIENKNVKKIVACNQWRTRLFENKIKKFNINKKIKVITALPYLYYMDRNISNPSITVNDKNTDYFIEQLIRLSHDLDHLQILLKFKNLRWLQNKHSSNLLYKLKLNKKIKIENDLSSYHCCAISDLVIGKPTSLCDETISVKIPTLISLDNNNFITKVSNMYDYFHKDILVTNYMDLKFKTQRILNRDPHYIAIFKNLSRKVYDNGVFNNSDKITNEINKIYQELT